MVFDYTAPTDLSKKDPNAQLLADYGSLSQKLPKAIATEKKARPWWSFFSGVASSFIPFGLGGFITPMATALVDKNKAQKTDKLNSYRRQLGLAEQADTSGSGLNLGGAGFAAGSSVATTLGRDTLPGEMNADGTPKTLNFSGIGGNVASYAQPSITQTPNDESYSRNPTMGDGTNPNAPAITGGGVTGLEGLPNTGYFGNGGGDTGLIATTQNGYTVAPSTSMRNGGKVNGGKINAPSHEEGGAELVDANTGAKKGIEVEGDERIVNNEDWTSVLGFLKKGKSKNALALLKSIDERKPVEGKAEGSIGQINLAQSPTGYFDFSEQVTDDIPAPQTENTDNVFANVTEVSSTPLSTTSNPLATRTNAPSILNRFNADEIVRYGFDVGKLGIGLNEAMKTLPQYQIPTQWGEHMDKARYFSEQGLLPEEKAEAIDLGNQAYATNVRDITNASGGNAGVLLGNLTAANLGRTRLANQLALADRQAKEASFDKYEGRLLKDMAMKKEIFDTQYNQALATKKEGMGLASDALSNISERADFNKYYGNGSYYDKLQKALVAKGASEADIAQQMAEHAKDPKFWLAATEYLKNNPSASDAEVEKEANKVIEKTKASTDKTLNPKTTSYADYLAWKTGKK